MLASVMQFVYLLYHAAPSILTSIYYNLHKNSQAVKKSCSFISLGEKSCEIKGGSEEMAAMMLMKIKFDNT